MKLSACFLGSHLPWVDSHKDTPLAEPCLGLLSYLCNFCQEQRNCKQIIVLFNILPAG